MIHETLDIFARIMQEVTGTGYSHKEAEEAFNALWSEGYDFEDVEKSVQLLIERLGVGIGWGAERQMKNPEEEEGTKEERKEESDSLERILHQVITLPDVADIVSGLIRWYNESSEEDVDLKEMVDL